MQEQQVQSATPKALHAAAMRAYESALDFRQEGKLELSIVQLREAYHLESKAANLLRDTQDAEPSRSILYRSAASMALQLGDFENAKSLIIDAMAGSPPPDIRNELQSQLALADQRRASNNAA